MHPAAANGAAPIIVKVQVQPTTGTSAGIARGAMNVAKVTAAEPVTADAVVLIRVGKISEVSGIRTHSELKKNIVEMPNPINRAVGL